jgi:glycosyltransferase involved in cell wall biosynthesis
VSIISCIMPTYNRRAFVPQAIAYFLRQDYPERELIIVDDGDDPVADVIPDDGRIRYLRLPTRHTVGAKRNLACEAARGEIIAHWDDDDWHAPHRLSYQVEALLQSGKAICGLTTLLFYESDTHKAWQFRYPGDRGHWLGGSTLMYRRDFWAAHRFPDVDVGEDARFVWSAHPHEVAVLDDHTFHVGIIHAHNISHKQRGGVYWHPHAPEHICALMGEDWLFYHPDSRCDDAAAPIRRLSDRPNRGEVQDPMEHVSPEITPAPMAVAQVRDLLLREYAALNHGQSLPIMRRWEIPYALFGAQLGNTMSVLNCTINPVGFESLLKRLYPHTYYRAWNPVQNNDFVLPRGAPDGGFDRVICINTLEHLLRPQRELLIAALSRKLKPGGLLILTSDYYFDSAWRNTHLLQIGVIRPDRSEVFNGWNRVTMREWIEICAPHGLMPLADAPPDPEEADPSLYLNQPPYTHACIGGIFYKPPAAPVDTGKRLVLALLTWNTRAISVESLHAHIAEARMLQRLGQQPMLCVVDNGSNDGTPDALRALEAEMEDIPHRFIFNRHNLGNSVARNQIIDAVLDWDADYLLFIDGDIELVPFSSFAMLRYMENQGHVVGCIGADSRWQTPDRGRSNQSWYSIDDTAIQTTNLVAWTQYGMFRRALFDEGVRFDVNAPFDEPGWGFEDNDLAFQMDVKGYLNCYFSGMTYLHRALHSSIGILRQNGYDPAALYTQRQQYVINKWMSVPRINNGPLSEVRRITLRI